MLNISVLKSDIDSFLKYVTPLCDGDKELANRVNYSLTALYNAYKEGGYIMPYEYEEMLDSIEEVSEICELNGYEELINDFPQMISLLAFHKRKVYRKPKYGGQ